MSFFVSDAAVLGLKEALKLAAVWFSLRVYLRYLSADYLLKPFYIGLGLTTLLFGTSFFWPAELVTSELFSRLVKYVFFIFFMGSLVFLYVERLRQGRDMSLKGGAPWLAVLGLTVVYFSPDILSSAIHIQEIAFMKANLFGVYLSAAVAFVVPLGITYLFLRKRGNALGIYFGLGQFLLVCALIKLLGGGSGAFGELSLIPSVQRGTMKLIHDIVHQTFAFFMVPDHPLVTTDVWIYVGLLFGSNFGLAAALAIMIIPPLWYLYSSLTTQLPGPEGVVSPAERRKFLSAAHKMIRKRTLPVVAFVLVVFISWYAEIGAATSELFVPQPKPVVEDKGVVIIPLTDPTMDLRDGNLHKFSVTVGTDAINILVIKRPEGKLAVCLDACEVCPPEGYGLRGDKVVCVYCMTPIPVDTLGKPGGCNPIPLDAQITGRDIRILVRELDVKWRDVKSGKSKESVR